MEKRCDRCAFYVAEADDAGRCQRYPPSQGFREDGRLWEQLKDTIVMALPLVRNDHWCGEFAAR